MLLIVGSHVQDMPDLYLRRQEAVMNTFLAQVITRPPAYPKFFPLSEPSEMQVIVAGDKKEIVPVRPFWKC
jgi:hypothetical protein